ncbi:MAG: DNA polymerase IV [Oligosphaeraceae bacterium]|nr:DNA polymerase IV [Oligosphaeraceae bacterium]
MNTAASNHILHLDLDAFFASVEQLDHPEWRGRPVIVGAAPDQRGVVSTCSYEARRFGVHSAMPSRTAFRLCPQGIFVPGRYERYAELSAQVMGVLRAFTPCVQPASIDEAFLDLSHVHGLPADPVETARQLKERIRATTGLTASVGVASNMFLAKLASDLHKPDGLTVVPVDPAEVQAFLAPLPVGKIWGVGPKTAQVLAKYSLRRIGDLQKTSVEALRRMLGNTSGEQIKALAHGWDNRAVQPEEAQEKSISHEETFPVDCRDPEQVRMALWRLAEVVGQRLRQAGLLAGTATVKLRYQDFRTVSRQMPIRPRSQADRVLLHCAGALWSQFSPGEPVRLVGFGVSALCAPGQEPVPGPQQQLLFADEPGVAMPAQEQRRNACLDQAVDRLRQQLGADALRRGWWPPAQEPGKHEVAGPDGPQK